MAINTETLAAAMAYTKNSLEGIGALEGKPCTIQSIEPITGETGSPLNGPMMMVTPIRTPWTL